jgi:hypothetical protein
MATRRERVVSGFLRHQARKVKYSRADARARNLISRYLPTVQCLPLPWRG